MKRYLHLNWPALLSMLALIVIGTIFIRSAGSARTIAALQTAWQSHAVLAAIALACYFVLGGIDYHVWLARLAKPAYLAAIVLLVAVLLLGEKIYGGRRWLWFFQPSELAKPAVILMLAQFLGTALAEGRHMGFTFFLQVMGLAAIPALLILAEPDLGTALVLVPTAVVMMLFARVWLKGLVSLLLVGILAAGLIIGTVWTAETKLPPDTREQVYRVLPLKPHQVSRIRVFLFPDSDPYGGGWNLRQAKISIGSGSIHGKGLGKGEQKFLGYLPPSVSMNDFIFSVLAEEAGFRGGAIVLSLFWVLVISILYIAARAEDDRGRLLCVGAATLIFCHVYVNVAMSIGYVPITGLPLPFISAGKTFLVSLMLLLGMVQSVSVNLKSER